MTPTALPNPQVFLDAAALVESRRYRFSCLALRHVLDAFDEAFYLTPEYVLYRHLYAPRWLLKEDGVWWVLFTQPRRIRALRRTARIAQRMRDTSFRVAGFEGVSNPS